MSSVRIGRSATALDWRRNDRFLDYLELDVENAVWPKRQRLAAWRQEAKSEFEFGLSLPVALAESTGQARASALDKIEELASVLRATWLVLRTPIGLRPTSAARRQLAELFERLEREGSSVAWQARGLWEPEEAREFAAESGVALVVDPTNDKAELDETRCYCRVSQLSTQGPLRAAHAESIAEKLFDHPDAYLVLPSRAAPAAARAVRQSLAWFGGDE